MLNRGEINALLKVPFLLALNLFGFFLEFILELPFMIAFYLRMATRKGRWDRLE
jgi:hypothetical protein